VARLLADRKQTLGNIFTSTSRYILIVSERLSGPAMRPLYAVLAALVFTVALTRSASAAIVVDIDRSVQRMAVTVDGVPRYNWRVSTARRGYITPPGTYHPEMLARHWFSKKYYNSPMPHSIFFYGGFAIHGSYEISHLGRPASHGCVRLDPGNAAILFGLVQREGMGATTIVIH
jgi:lipoprotein-anchoring transpeptidase ErfK/SrfK